MNDAQIEELICKVVASTLEKVLGPNLPEGYLTTTDLSASLKVPPDTIRTWAKNGCPHIRVGKGAHRFRLTEVVSWLQSR